MGQILEANPFASRCIHGKSRDQGTQGTRDRGGWPTQMSSCFNCRERALLPPLFLCAMAIAFLVGLRGNASAAPQQQSAPSAAPAPVFDVAAIHLHEPQPHEHNSIWSSPFDGHFNAENVSAITLIEWAFEMPETRILDAPGWANTTMFNIEATADPVCGPAIDRPHLRRRPQAKRKDGSGLARRSLPPCDAYGNARAPHLRAGRCQGRRKTRRHQIRRHHDQLWAGSS